MNTALATYFGFGVLLGGLLLALGVGYLCGRLLIFSLDEKWTNQDIEDKVLMSVMGTLSVGLIAVVLIALFVASQQIARNFGWM